MMRRLGLGGLAALLAVVLVQAPAIRPAAAADEWETVKTYTVEKKNDAVKFGKKLVSESDKQIKKLEADAAKASGDTKAAYNESLADLKVKRAAAKKKLDEMGKATGSAWDSAKNGFADAYKDLHDSFDKAKAKLK